MCGFSCSAGKQNPAHIVKAYRMHYLIGNIPDAINVLLHSSLIAALLFLAVKTKSKGITLIGITKIVSIAFNTLFGFYQIKLYGKHFEAGGDLENLPALPTALVIISHAEPFAVLVIFLLGVFIVYREYKVNKFSTAQVEEYMK